MQVNLLGSMDDEASIDIPGWQDVRTSIESLTRNQQVQDLVDAHATTIRRIGSADYHYHILNQVYIPDRIHSGAHTISWAQVGAESVVFWLYTALNSLANELNLAYGFGIDEWKVDVTHPLQHNRNLKPGCFRCRLIQHGDNLSSYLEGELNSEWFKFFNELRNRIAHRQLLSPNINISFGARSGIFIEISHNPRAKRFTESPRNGIEINGFCVESRRDVVRVIGEAYTLLNPKIRQI
jgi:hypothetical protein